MERGSEPCQWHLKKVLSRWTGRASTKTKEIGLWSLGGWIKILALPLISPNNHDDNSWCLLSTSHGSVIMLNLLCGLSC